jgi:hypothetical protein
MHIYKKTAEFIAEKCGESLADLSPDYRLSSGNSKLARDGIQSFNLLPIIHCPSAGACKAYCYADVGQQAFKAARLRRARAFLATLEPDFHHKMAAEIKRSKAKIVRIHDSGDFYSRAYFDKWNAIASYLPGVHFYAYTKMINFVALPRSENFNLIQSEGGKCDAKVISELPHARIFSSLAELQAAGYSDCSESDLPAALGANKVGLIIHGARKSKFKGGN